MHWSIPTGSPRLSADHTSGFVSVGLGAVYCLPPAPGVNVAGTAGTASEEAFSSGAFAFVTVRYDPTHANCGANQLEVKTFGTDGGLTGQAAFTVGNRVSPVKRARRRRAMRMGVPGIEPGTSRV